MRKHILKGTVSPEFLCQINMKEDGLGLQPRLAPKWFFKLVSSQVRVRPVNRVYALLFVM
jgi:hypothetical protein